MVLIVEKQKQAFEGPREITVDNVQYWSRHTKTLQSTQSAKALKFLRYGCIRYVKEEKRFICLPLNTKSEWTVKGITYDKRPFPKDYNFSEYEMKNADGVWSCNCQGYDAVRKRGELPEDGVACSHLLALIYFFKTLKYAD